MDKRVEADFALLVAAAVAGERCPQTKPHGPIHEGSLSALWQAGRIKSEVFAHNWRRVTILTGEHRGATTKGPSPLNGPPYRINGVDAGLHRARAARKISP